MKIPDKQIKFGFIIIFDTFYEYEQREKAIIIINDEKNVKFVGELSSPVMPILELQRALPVVTNIMKACCLIQNVMVYKKSIIELILVYSTPI